MIIDPTLPLVLTAPAGPDLVQEVYRYGRLIGSVRPSRGAWIATEPAEPGAPPVRGYAGVRGTRAEAAAVLVALALTADPEIVPRATE